LNEVDPLNDNYQESEQSEPLMQKSTSRDVQDIQQNIQSEQKSESQTDNPFSSLYQRRFVKQITVKDGKAEMKTYKEINKNGKRFYEEKLDDGDKTKIKRIMANGDIKEITRNSRINRKKLIKTETNDDSSDVEKSDIEKNEQSSLLH
jgi:hypothetical protein